MSAGHQDEARVRIALASPVSGLRERLEALDSIRVIEADEDAAVIVFRGDQKARHELLRRLLADGLPVCAFAQEQVNLQDTYLATVRAADRGVAP